VFRFAGLAWLDQPQEGAGRLVEPAISGGYKRLPCDLEDLPLLPQAVELRLGGWKERAAARSCGVDLLRRQLQFCGPVTSY